MICTLATWWRFQIGSNIEFANRRYEDLAETHLPQEVIDPVELRLVDVLVDLLRQRPRGGEIVAERLLHHDAARLGQAGVGTAP